MENTTIITITSGKGGPGKTTTAVNLAAAFGRLKKRVLIIDNDKQGDTSKHIFPKDIKMEHTTLSLYEGTSLKKAIYPSTAKNVDIVPAKLSLSKIALTEESNSNKYFLLKNVINKETTKDYDYVIIDVPAHLGIYTYNAIVVSDLLIIPIDGFLAMQNFSPYKRVVESFAQDYKLNVKIDSIVLTKVKNRATAYKDIKEMMESDYENLLCETVIPDSVKFMEAPSYKKCIYDYSPRSTAAVQHMKFAKELLNKWGDAK